MTDNNNTTQATYLIPDCNLPEFERRLEELNKRGKRLGCTPITYTKEEDHRQVRFHHPGATNADTWTYEHNADNYQRRHPNAVPTGEVRVYWGVQVCGEAPKYNGWIFVATLEPLATDSGEAMNLLQCVPGQVCPHEYRERVGECDHCGYKRNRKQTFVVRHEDGTHKMVGRQCIRDFLGHEDPERIARMAEWLAQLDQMCGQAEEEGWGGGGRAARTWDIESFLAWTVGSIQTAGWCSRTAAREDDRRTATADHVLYMLDPPPFTGPYAHQARAAWKAACEEAQPNEERVAEAQAARAWALDLPTDELEQNNYLANINLVARAGLINGSTAGLAASIVVAHRKALEREIERQQRTSRPDSHHVGTVGKRQEFVVQVERVIEVESMYGLKGIHKMVDDAGNDLVWFASGDKWLEPGHQYTIKATVKAHDDYQGRPQTVVQRVAVVAEVATTE